MKAMLRFLQFAVTGDEYQFVNRNDLLKTIKKY